MSAEDLFCNAGSSCETNPCGPDATCVPTSYCLSWTCFRCSESRIVGMCSSDTDCPDVGDRGAKQCIHQYLCDPKTKRVAASYKAPTPPKAPAPISLSVLPKHELDACSYNGCPSGQLCLPLSLCVGKTASGSKEAAPIVGSCEHDRRCPEKSTCIRRFRCADPKVLKPIREGKPVTAAPSRPGRLPEPVKKIPGPALRPR